MKYSTYQGRRRASVQSLAVVSLISAHTRSPLSQGDGVALPCAWPCYSWIRQSCRRESLQRVCNGRGNLEDKLCGCVCVSGQALTSDCAIQRFGRPAAGKEPGVTRDPHAPPSQSGECLTPHTPLTLDTWPADLRLGELKP